MNKIESDILISLKKDKFVNQRYLSKITGYSLGTVNQALNNLTNNNYFTNSFQLTNKAFKLFEHCKANKAVILAAGVGIRAVPINKETPKAFLEINGEKLIERQIKQLHEAKINDIYIVVGYMKETFEYLIDDFNVNLIINSEYSTKNNLHSLFLAKEHLENTYIIPSDIWFEQNPFLEDELYSWYMVGDYFDDDSEVRINRKNELVKVKKGTGGNAMIGLSYLTKDDSIIIKDKLVSYNSNPLFDNAFWEETLFNNDKMMISYKNVNPDNAVEINTYEQLRDLDPKSKQLKNNTIDIIKKTFNVSSNKITEIKNLKKGMTNRSFLFNCNGKDYIMRVPGEGTDMLINRKQERDVYLTIKDKNISDKIIYINPDNGYKITEYIHSVRNCDPCNKNDVKRCIKYLREFHEMKLKVNHTFDIYKQILFYESLWTESSAYKDYAKTKVQIFELKDFIDKNAKEYYLTHIDAVPDNFLIYNDDKDIKLIDWEYAGMQDQDVDIAMFAIYSLYDKDQIDKLIDLYYVEGCQETVRTKIYCYVAICGFLWSNWCEYKRMLGVEFGEYSIRQYRYAKDYYKYAMERIKDVQGR